MCLQGVAIAAGEALVGEAEATGAEAGVLVVTGTKALISIRIDHGVAAVIFLIWQ